MSVEPGFGGQQYISESTNRIKKIKSYLNDNCLERVLIEVDGGIKLGNVHEVIEAEQILLFQDPKFLNLQTLYQ